MGLKTYVKESYNELVNKTSWPTMSELQSSAIVVLVAMFIISLIVLVMDLAFSFIMRDGIYNLLG
jgi:preprotein translocase subunit SecE